MNNLSEPKLTTDQVLEIVGVSRVTFLKMQKCGAFPVADVKETRPHLWYESTVIAWKQGRQRNKIVA